MLTVTELANLSGTTPHAVRYYTRLGLLQPGRNPDNGYHLYRPSEINALRFIRQDNPLEILKARYARGEIDEEEYERRRRELEK